MNNNKKIMKDSKVFDTNYIPDKIPVRQKLVDEICSKLKIMKNYRLFLSGLTGNGKTLSVKKALNKLENSVTYVYINCSEINTYIAIAKKILESIKNKPYYEKGKSRYDLANDLKKLLLTKRTKSLIFIFDEIDKLIIKKENHYELFFPLLNYGNSSFILISNDTNILEKMDARIMSRLSPEKKVLDIYYPDEIYQILKQRARLGLSSKSFDDDILIKIAKFSSEVSGDIRFAIKLLEQTAITTELSNQKKISEGMIKEAIKESQISDINKIYSSIPKHLKIVIIALCKNAKLNGDFAITYPDSYKTYVILAKNQQFGAVGERQFRDYLSSLKMLGLFELQWRSPISRRGRVRIAIPTFDFLKFLDTINGNKGDGMGYR